MRDDLELIEVFDADPSAFGPSPRSASRTGDPTEPGDDREAPDAPPRSWPWISVVSVVLVAAMVALLVWSPWSGTTSLVFTDPRPAESELTERLVFDDPPSDLRLAALGSGGDDADNGPIWNSESIGYFFGSPDATFDPDDGIDRWFGFFALPSDHPSTPLVFGQREIAGAPAEVSDETQGALVDMAWGPVDGYTFTAAGSQMTIDEAVAIAEQLRIVDGRPVVVDDSVLDGMVGLGPFGDYVALATLVQYAQNNGRGVDGLVGLYYGFDGHSVVSVPGNATTLDLVGFVMQPDAEERTVHGLPAIGFTKGAGPFGGFDSSTVLWWEGGRVILVAGDGDLSATFELAESVRPATDEEWAEVVALD
ncbi:MAG: hypothetical protein HY828_10355 [Actinobacteria bacterium]|nr:hypothetical protein [Actinomycetota bacterium]